MSDAVRLLAVEQRKRLVASIMVYIEQQPWWRDMSADARGELRQKVLDSIGSYHDFMLDVIKVNGKTSVQNEEIYQILRQIHRQTRPKVDA